MGQKLIRKFRNAIVLAVGMFLCFFMPMRTEAATWKFDNAGWWWQRDDNSYPASSWELINGNWYYFDGAGYIVTGWQEIDGAWYYLGEPGDGAMKTDQWVGNYYVKEDGRMATNQWIGEYYVGADGAWIPGYSTNSHTAGSWVQSGDRWWYRNVDGTYPSSSWKLMNGAWYYFDASGYMVTGWQEIDGAWYYFGESGDGTMKTNQWVGNYYVKEDGKMVTNQWIGEYYVGADGAWIQNASGNAVQQPASSSGYYYYSLLNEEEKRAYDIMLDAVMNFKAKVDIGTKDFNVKNKAKDALQYDHPEIFWTDWGTSYTYPSENVNIMFEFIYNMTQADKDSMQAMLEERVNSLLSGISANASDYDKAKYVYDTIANNVEYDDSAPFFNNILGSLIGGKAACGGYSCATQYLLQRLGIQCLYVLGWTSGLHAWNIVNLDGKYYHIDMTAGDVDSRGTIDYDYFCAKDSEISGSHIALVDFALPSCTSINCNYYVQNGLYFDTWNPDAVGALIKSAYVNGNDEVTLKFANEQLVRQGYNYFVEQFHAHDYIGENTHYTYIVSPGFNTLSFRF